MLKALGVIGNFLSVTITSWAIYFDLKFDAPTVDWPIETWFIWLFFNVSFILLLSWFYFESVRDRDLSIKMYAFCDTPKQMNAINKHFYAVSKRRIKRVLGRLRKDGFIKIEKIHTEDCLIHKFCSVKDVSPHVSEFEDED